MVIKGKTKQVSAIYQFYEQPEKEIGFFEVVWPENNEPVKMIVIDDPLAPVSYGPNSAEQSQLQTIRDKSS